jgi:hypothetical protein
LEEEAVLVYYYFIANKTAMGFFWAKNYHNLWTVTMMLMFTHEPAPP